MSTEPPAVTAGGSTSERDALMARVKEVSRTIQNRVQKALGDTQADIKISSIEDTEEHFPLQGP